MNLWIHYSLAEWPYFFPYKMEMPKVDECPHWVGWCEGRNIVCKMPEPPLWKVPSKKGTITQHRNTGFYQPNAGPHQPNTGLYQSAQPSSDTGLPPSPQLPHITLRALVSLPGLQNLGRSISLASLQLWRELVQPGGEGDPSFLWPHPLKGWHTCLPPAQDSKDSKSIYVFRSQNGSFPS